MGWGILVGFASMSLYARPGSCTPWDIYLSRSGASKRREQEQRAAPPKNQIECKNRINSSCARCTRAMSAHTNRFVSSLSVSSFLFFSSFLFYLLSLFYLLASLRFSHGFTQRFSFPVRCHCSRTTPREPKRENSLTERPITSLPYFFLFHLSAPPGDLGPRSDAERDATPGRGKLCGLPHLWRIPAPTLHRWTCPNTALLYKLTARKKKTRFYRSIKSWIWLVAYEDNVRHV